MCELEYSREKFEDPRRTYYFSMKIETDRKLEIFRVDNEVPFRFFIDVQILSS